MYEKPRQGEVWLKKVDPNKVPKNYVKTPAGENGALLARGEGGNTHTVVVERGVGLNWLHDATVDIANAQFRHNGATSVASTMFIEVEAPGRVEHSEHLGHAPAPLTAGVFEIKIKREQFPWEAEARRVAD